MSILTSSSGVDKAVLPCIAFSTNCDCTSMFTNCFSNVSMVSEIFWRLLLARAESNALTMLPIDFVMTFILACVSSRAVTASNLHAIQR